MNNHMHLPAVVDVETAAELLATGQPATLMIDVRTPAEFESLHIPGSYNVPLDLLAEHCDELRHLHDRPVILVCRSGQRARQAEELLRAANLPQVHILEGGISAWEQAGKPMRRGRQRWSLERQVRGVAGALVLLGTLGGLLVWRPLTLVALAIGAGLTYSAVTDTCGLAMLLSKLPYNRGATCNVRDVVRQLTDASATIN
ncbi:rhodanese-like domain-containing protein [Kallotenue papyrolyticum]|uniref:rhodanese-like domain-containing protein n=1 Tax=Kallotenue papyrolyticum TaxID=1325125 RepID=UPI0004B46869|nr:rhodanese-like domain-containing protein [Kallotenue papyrolyticum]